MKSYVAAAGIFFVLLAMGVGVVSYTVPRQERIYALATVTEGLAHHPTAWAGHTFLIRATVIDIRQRFPTVTDARVVLTPPLPAQDPQTTTLGERILLSQMASHEHTLTLITRPPTAPLAILRLLPIVDKFVPPPQRGNAFGSDVYHVQLASAAQSCLLLHIRRLSRATLLKKLHLPRWRGCYDGVLLDYVP